MLGGQAKRQVGEQAGGTAGSWKSWMSGDGVGGISGYSERNNKLDVPSCNGGATGVVSSSHVFFSQSSVHQSGEEDG